MQKKQYNNPQYWHEWYKQTNFNKIQWLYPAVESVKIIGRHLLEDKKIKILEIGCGTSVIAQKLCAEGYSNIICTDCCKLLIKERIKRSKEPITFQPWDITTKSNYQSESFDVVLDKNTIDCLFTGADSLKNVLKCMSQLHRILKIGGTLLSISHGQPKARKYFYTNLVSPFQLTIIPLINIQTKNNQERDNFLYICKKNQSNFKANSLSKEQENTQTIKKKNSDFENQQQKDCQNQSESIQNKQKTNTNREQNNEQCQQKKEQQNNQDYDQKCQQKMDEQNNEMNEQQNNEQITSSMSK